MSPGRRGISRERRQEKTPTEEKKEERLHATWEEAGREIFVEDRTNNEERIRGEKRNSLGGGGRNSGGGEKGSGPWDTQDEKRLVRQ